MIHARDDYIRIQDPSGKIPEDEPVFLLRGQDVLAPGIITEWAKKLVEKGGDEEMALMAVCHAIKMHQWQKDNGIVKLPDL